MRTAIKLSLVVLALTGCSSAGTTGTTESLACPTGMPPGFVCDSQLPTQSSACVQTMGVDTSYRIQGDRVLLSGFRPLGQKPCVYLDTSKAPYRIVVQPCFEGVDMAYWACAMDLEIDFALPPDGVFLYHAPALGLDISPNDIGFLQGSGSGGGG